MLSDIKKRETKEFESKEGERKSVKLLNWTSRGISCQGGIRRYFFSPEALNENLESCLHSKLFAFENRYGIVYSDELVELFNNSIQEMNPVVKFLFDNGDMPSGRDIMNVCKMDAKFNVLALVDLSLILGEIEETKEILKQLKRRSDLFDCLWHTDNCSSIQDSLFSYLTMISFKANSRFKSQIIMSRIVCDLMRSPNARAMGIATLFEEGLYLDAYIMSAVFASKDLHQKIKCLVESKLGNLLPNMAFLNSLENFKPEMISETSLISKLTNLEPVLAYRFIKIFSTVLENENVNLETLIAGRVSISSLFQTILLSAIIKEDLSTARLILHDFWSSISDSVLCDMFVKLERVYFRQVFQILCDTVEIMNHITKSKTTSRSVMFDYSNSGLLGSFVTLWLEKGWLCGDVNNNNNQTLVVTSTSILQKFTSLTQDPKLKFCINFALSIIRQESFPIKTELSALQMDENEKIYAIFLLRKNFVNPLPDNETSQAVFEKLNSVLLNNL